jgi:CRISPR/Cas system CSM-associated protein Csm2 small subunit
LDVVITKTLSNIREERSRAFFDELTKTSRQLEPTVLESEDFLHCYFATVRYALNSRRREKIQMFARLLKASLGETGPRDVDEYEEFLEILDDLTFRELQALAIMDSFSVRPRTPEQNNLQWTNTFWDEFEDRIVRELRVPKDEVSDFLNRISRTACYEIFTGGYMDYTGGKGKLTPTYRRLKRFISSEAENAA